MALTAQFPPGDPLIIRIEQVNGEWTIRPSTIDRSGGKTHSQIMDERRQVIEPAVLDDYSRRRSGGSPGLPRFKTEAGHVPIVVLSGEKVQFRSENNAPFAIWIDRDPNVTVEPSSPQSPFGLALPETATGGVSSMMTVGSNTAVQRFYKCTAYVQTAAGTIIVDPDVLGGD